MSVPASSAVRAALASSAADAPANRFSHGLPIADDEAGKLPLVAEHLREEVTVGRGRDAIVCVEGGHYRGGAGANSGLEDRQEEVSHREDGDFGVIIITAADRRAVSDEVLETRRDSIWLRNIFPLQSSHPRCRVEASEIRILAEGFRHASPAWVTGEVTHRSEDPVDPSSPALARRDYLQFLEQSRVPRT